jgi:hypothetical protein
MSGRYWYDGYDLKDHINWEKPYYHLVFDRGYEELLYLDSVGHFVKEFQLIAWHGIRPVWNGPLSLKKVEALGRDFLPLFVSFDVLSETFKEHLKGEWVV